MTSVPSRTDGIGGNVWTSDPKSRKMARVKRVLSKIRPDNEPAAGNGVSHVRLLGAAPASARSAYVVTTAERAPCTCPDFCERDHDNE